MAVKNGAKDFYAGGAVGFDTLSSALVLKLCEVYPYIKLNLILPCPNEEQTEKWSKAEKVEFYRILRFADVVEYTSNAKRLLACEYISGKNFEKDIKKGIPLLTEYADSGDAFSCYKLGNLCLKGEIVN